MTLTSYVLFLVLLPIPPAEPGPFRVSVVVSPKPYYVGRAIELSVEVDSGPGATTLEVPSSPDFIFFPMTPAKSPPTTSRFMAVPSRAGSLEIPPFRARAGEKSVTSKPTRLMIANLPAEGRTSAFLGGSGPFEVRSESDRANVRLGETLDFRVHLVGEAAWGSVRAPDLNEWNTPTLKVEPLSDTLQPIKKPVRSFPYRIRFLKPGPVILPPISVAAFDPAVRRYVTKVTSSVTVQVEAPPRFNPEQLIYSSRFKTNLASTWRTVGLLSVAMAVAFALLLTTWLVAKLRRRASIFDPTKLAIELSTGLKDRDDPVEEARAVVEALTMFLHRAGRRPTGVLTPEEARVGFKRLSGDAELAAIAKALVERSDRTRYGTGDRRAEGIVGEGRIFFEEVAVAMLRVGKGPGEAVETASES